MPAANQDVSERFAALWLFNCRVPCCWSRIDLNLVNVSAGSFPVRIPTQEPAENLCPPWLLGEFRGARGCWDLSGELTCLAILKP